MRNSNPSAKKKVPSPPELPALRRAAKTAIELARRTGTPAWIMVDGKLVDATKLRKRPTKKRRD